MILNFYRALKRSPVFFCAFISKFYLKLKSREVTLSIKIRNNRNEKVREFLKFEKREIRSARLKIKVC